MRLEMMSIEVDNHCNIRCSICPSGNGLIKKRGRISLGTVRRAVDMAQGWTDKVSLAVMGEALLHPDIEKMIGHIKGRGISPLLWTNGMLMTREKALGVMDAGLDKVIFSYEIIDKELYESVRCGGEYDRVRANLDGFLEERDRRGLGVEVGVWSIVPDFSRPLAIPDELLAHYPGVEFYTSYAMDWHGAIELKGRPEIERGAPRPCSQISRFFNIGWTGDVLCCCNDFNHEYVLGNIDRAKGLEEIWDAPPRKRLIERMAEADLEGVRPCESCSGPYVTVGAERILVKGGEVLSGADASSASRKVHAV